MSEVRGSGQEYQKATAQERLRGATPRLRSGAATGRRYTKPQARGKGGGQEELPHGPKPKARGGRQEAYPRPPHPRPRAAARRSNPTSKELWLRRHRRA